MLERFAVRRSTVISKTASCLALVPFLLAFGTLVQAKPLTISAGGGVYVPLSRELREVYGSGGAFTAALLAPLVENRSRLRVEVSYVAASGPQIEEDPTFELDENRFWLVPLSLGLETNAHPTGGADAVRVFVGLHAILAFTGWEDPLLGDFRSPAMGGAFEVRPELPVRRDLALWVSYRLAVLSEVDYRPAGGRATEFAYTGGTMQAGLAYTWR
jgi:hypothetical protein